jgi:uncharacterized delta-60 repeat protein
MRVRARNLLVAGALVAGSGGCVAIFDFSGFDTSAPDPIVIGAEGGGDADMNLRGDFALSATPARVGLAQGESTAVKIVLDRRDGFAAPVALSAKEIPEGVTINATGTVIGAGSSAATLTMTAGTTARPSNGTIVIHGSAGQRDQTAMLEVFVRGTPGTLDMGFGQNGVVTIDFGSSVSNPDMLVGIDDRIVIGSTFADGANRTIALARLTPDGKPDLTFGDQGKDTTTLPAASDFTSSVYLAGLPGRLVAGVGDTTNAWITRYLENGSLDMTFGANGIANVPSTTNLTKLAGVMQRPGGQIVLAGAAGGAPALVQLGSAGAIDGTFAQAGVATHAGTMGEITVATLAPDGKVIAAGPIGGGEAATFAFLADGTAEGPPRSLGVICGSFADIAVNDAGDRFACGDSWTGKICNEGIDVPLVALGRSDGGAGSGFGSDGGVFTPPRGASAARAIIADAQQRLVLAGDSTGELHVQRIVPDGGADLGFGSMGFVTTGIGTNAIGSRVRLQRDGGIIVGGVTKIGGRVVFVVARYWP